MPREPAQVVAQRAALGRRLAEFRGKRGLSQREFAARIFYHRSSITKIESGQQPAPRKFWATADQMLGAGGELVAGFDDLAAAKAAAREPSPLSTASGFGSGVAANGEPERVDGWLRPRVSDADLERIRSDARMFSQLDQRYGGAHVLWMIEQYLQRDVAPMLTYYPDHDDVLTVAAVMHRKAGLASFDSADGQLAQHHFRTGQQLAHRARNGAVEGHILVSAAHHAITSGHPSAALDLLDHAQNANGRHGAGLRAKIEVMRARAFARMADKSACQAAIGRAERAFGRGQDADEWVSTVSEAYLAGQIAHCQQALGGTREAVQYATTARDHFPATHVRRYVMTTCQLAISYVAMGEVEHAAALGGQALGHAAGLRSSRALTWIHRLEGALLPHRKAGAVSVYLDAADAVVHDAGGLSADAGSKILNR